MSADRLYYRDFVFQKLISEILHLADSGSYVIVISHFLNTSCHSLHVSSG